MYRLIIHTSYIMEVMLLARLLYAGGNFIFKIFFDQRFLLLMLTRNYNYYNLYWTKINKVCISDIIFIVK
jgi:hypothetical protein